jgi:SAM-dependent methyltransferase
MMYPALLVQEAHLHYLCCPSCQGELSLAQAHRGGGRIEHGTLRCSCCGSQHPIIGFIPRFVPTENYALSFGLEWNLHDRTQYDQTSGTPTSETRFFEETRWPRRLDGQVVIEAGSGAGRFTEHALNAGAMVLSLDYSNAVDANYRSNGQRDNLLLVQGDLFRMPFRFGAADRLFCFGVLQHTPDPRGALAAICQYVRPDGEIVADIYAKTFARWVLGTKYWVRPLTRRIPPERLYRLTSRYVEAVWPLARRVQRIRKLGRPLSWRLLIPDYSDLLGDEAALKETALLDIFDMLAPNYDKPARLRTIRRWCSELPLQAVRVHAGYNGYEIHARVRRSTLHQVRPSTDHADVPS